MQQTILVGGFNNLEKWEGLFHIYILYNYIYTMENKKMFQTTNQNSKEQIANQGGEPEVQFF